jgi:hypothetical protein
MELVHVAAQNAHRLQWYRSPMDKSGSTLAPRSPARVYEEFFMPALFQQWGQTTGLELE